MQLAFQAILHPFPPQWQEPRQRAQQQGWQVVQLTRDKVQMKMCDVLVGAGPSLTSRLMPTRP